MRAYHRSAIVVAVQQALVERKLDMSVRRDKRFGTWFYRKWVRTPDGRKVRIFGTPKSEGLPETRVGAEEAERRSIARVLETGDPKPVVETKEEVPTIEEFHKVFLAASSIINKPSSVDSKEKLLRFHIVPRLGQLRLDEVTYAVIEDFKLALSQTAINTGKMYVGVKQDTKSTKRLSGKTINNVLTVLRRMLVVARKRGLIENVPDVEWLKSERSEVGQAARDPARDRGADCAQRATTSAWPVRVLRRERWAVRDRRHAPSAGACVQEGWPPPDRMARAPPHLRLTPRDAWGFDEGGAGAAWALVDPDDDALRPPRAGSG